MQVYMQRESWPFFEAVQMECGIQVLEFPFEVERPLSFREEDFDISLPMYACAPCRRHACTMRIYKEVAQQGNFIIYGRISNCIYRNNFQNISNYKVRVI